jgi:hypothetical protein
MRVIRHLSFAVLVVLASCSRSSSPSSRTAADDAALTRAKLSNDLEITLAELAKLTNESGGAHLTRTLMKREITLSKQQPTDSFLGARFVEVALDGTTTIEVLKTTNRLRAAVGAFFTSPEYGRAGLQVLSASSERQEVRLERTWCE